MTAPSAFVAMQFTRDPWNDSTYQAIRTVLREAGYTVVRADEVATSSAAVGEILAMLSDADLVVFDTTGDSASVAYELGYCHGIKRQPAQTILLRRRGEPPSFSYAHFRHHVYDDTRHLRRLLRHRLNISTPLPPNHPAFALAVFLPEEPVGLFSVSLVAALLATLRDLDFSGRCECYGRDNFALRNFSFGIGLKASSGKKLTYNWWQDFEERFIARLAEKDDRLTVDPAYSEHTDIFVLSSTALPMGTVELDEGRPVRLLNPEDDDTVLGGMVTGAGGEPASSPLS